MSNSTPSKNANEGNVGVDKLTEAFFWVYCRYEAMVFENTMSPKQDDGHFQDTECDLLVEI